MPRQTRARVIGQANLERKFRALDDATQTRALERSLLAGILVLENAIKQNIQDRKLVDTGTMLRSVGSEITERSTTRVTAVAGTNLVYAAIHEFGGTIVPRNAQFLSIPLTSEAKRYNSPRDFPQKLHAIINGDRGVLVDEGDTAQYALVKSVNMPARPYMRPAWDEHIDEAVGEVRDVLRLLIRQAVT